MILDPRNPKFDIDPKAIAAEIKLRVKTADLSGPAGEEIENKTVYVFRKLQERYPETKGLSYELLQELVNLNETFRITYMELDSEWNALSQVPSFMAASLTEAEAQKLQADRLNVALKLREKSEAIEIAAREFKAKRELAEQRYVSSVEELYRNKNLFIANYPAEALPIKLTLEYVKFEAELRAKQGTPVTEESKRSINTARRYFLRELLNHFQMQMFEVAKEGGSLIDYVRSQGVNIAVFPIASTSTV